MTTHNTPVSVNAVRELKPLTATAVANSAICRRVCRIICRRFCLRSCRRY